MVDFLDSVIVWFHRLCCQFYSIDVFPAKAGTQASAGAAPARWAPAFAGVTSGRETQLFDHPWPQLRLSRRLALRLVEGGGEVGEAARRDRLAQPCHEVAVVVEIVPGQQHRTEDLLAADEMMKIRPAVICASRAGALLVDRPWVVAMARVAQVQFAATGEGLRGAIESRTLESWIAAFEAEQTLGDIPACPTKP